MRVSPWETLTVTARRRRTCLARGSRHCCHLRLHNHCDWDDFHKNTASRAVGGLIQAGHGSWIVITTRAGRTPTPAAWTDFRATAEPQSQDHGIRISTLSETRHCHSASADAFRHEHSPPLALSGHAIPFKLPFTLGHINAYRTQVAWLQIRTDPCRDRVARLGVTATSSGKAASFASIAPGPMPCTRSQSS